MPEPSPDTKNCPLCGETIKAAAIKCRFCNSDLAAYEETRKAAIEETLFDGHPAVIYSFKQWIPIPVIAAAAIAVYAGGINGWYVTGAALLAVVVVYAGYWMQSLRRAFRLTTQRVSVTTGLFSSVCKNVELFRIDHFELHKPLGMKMTGHCALKLFTSDKELEEFYLYGIPNLPAIAETLRECQLRERSRRGLTTFVKA